MTVKLDPNAPQYIVLRAHPGAPDGWMPSHLEGRWENKPAALELLSTLDYEDWDWTARGVPTGRYEQRFDGVIAEVYELWPR